MVLIKYIKKTENLNVGEIWATSEKEVVNNVRGYMSKKSAEGYVKAGYAEYIDKKVLEKFKKISDDIKEEKQNQKSSEHIKIDTLKGKYVKQNAMFCLNGTTEPYLAENLYSSDSTLFFCEGYHDALAIHYAGYPAIAMGTCAISQSFIDKYWHQLEKFERLIICFDNEDSGAGEKGLRSLVKRLVAKGLTNICVATLPKDEESEKIDISEFLSKHDLEEQKRNVEFLIKEKSQYLHDFFFRNIEPYAGSEHNLTPREQKEQDILLSELISYLELLPKTIQIRYEKKLAEIFGFTKSEFDKLIKGLKSEIHKQKKEIKQETEYSRMTKQFIKELWMNEHSAAYASIVVDDHIENWPIHSETFKNAFISHHF